jgi:hypothetical protein
MKIASFAKAKAAADQASKGGGSAPKAKARKATAKKAPAKKAKACKMCGKDAKKLAAIKSQK